MRPYVLLSMFVPALLLGCASTFVKKNPGPHDNGIRYNLPKPYLLVETAKVTAADGTVTHKKGLVSIKMEMKPDYGEEYSIHVRAGVGINKTQITLKDGWQLTQIDNDIDSNASENINAVTDAITKLAPLLKDKDKAKPPGTNPAASVVDADATKKAFATKSPEYVAHAHNVPLGYYESVIGTDSCGKKHLVGWRYVGFLPFQSCPTRGCGVDVANCAEAGLYGLVYEKGVMCFKSLGDIANDTVVAK